MSDLAIEEKKEKISKKIYTTYANNLDSLPARERIHFVRRAYRATGEEAFSEIMKEWSIRHTIPAIHRGAKIVRRVIDEGGVYPAVKIDQNTKNPRILKRNEVLEKNPEVQFYRRYLMNMFQAKLMGLQYSHMGDTWDEYINHLKRVDFDKIFINEQAIFGVSSFAVNTSFFVSQLDIDKDFSIRFVDYLYDLYFDQHGDLKLELDKWEFITLIYNLTHIIIAESQFYQKSVDSHLWVNEFFSNNIDKILDVCGVDVIAEVGLCIKLSNQEEYYRDAFQKLEGYIIKKYRYSKMLNENVLIKKEHTNCVIMLLFKKIENWHSDSIL